MKNLFFSVILLVICTASTMAQKTAADHFKYGYEHYLKNEPQQALDFFNKSIELDGGIANTYFIRATTNLLLKHYDNAVSDYEKAIEKGYPNKHIAYKYIAEAYMLQGKKEEGQKYMKKSQEYPEPTLIDGTNKEEEKKE